MVKKVVNTVSKVTAQILFDGAHEILGMDIINKERVRFENDIFS